MKSKAKVVESDLELTRQVANLCHQGYYPMAALKIVDRYTTEDSAKEFIDSIHGRYIGDSLRDELFDIVTVLLE